MIFLALLIGLLIGVVLSFFILFQFGVKSSQANNKQQPAVSVIIAAKNEENNIRNCLRSIIRQNYVNFEIIVVDDHSGDQTFHIAKGFKDEFAHLKIIKAHGNGKKSAIKEGILQAQHEYLIFTDADCQPQSNYWIKEMISYFDDQISIVLGYSPYRFEKNLINYLQQYETLLTACLYVTATHFYQPYMAVGRNLAYKKSLFLQSDQFDSHLDVLSGDDDLFIQKMANKKNTKVCLKPTAFVQSKPKKDLKSLFQQKLRHISTSNRYRRKDQLLLGLFFIARFGILLGFLELIIFSAYQLVATFCLLVYLILWQIAFIIPCQKLKLSSINWYVPLLDIFLVIFQLALMVKKLFSTGNIRWKNG